MYKKFRLTVFSKEIPKKFKWINCLILLPIVFWPMIFFASIFFFDDPNANEAVVWSLFFGVNLYPCCLLLLFELNARIYKRFKYLGYIIPFAIAGFLTFQIIKMYIRYKINVSNAAALYSVLNFTNA